MPSRIINRSRVVWHNFERVPRPSGTFTSKRGESCAEAIPPNSPAAPFRDGDAVYDAEEELAYRCVSNLNPLDGWAPTEFWQDRWSVDHRDVVIFAQAGFLDAAFNARSQVKRYRCRNEYGLLQSELYARQTQRALYRRKNLQNRFRLGDASPWTYGRKPVR